MFSKKSKYMLAVCSGVSMPLSEMPDEAFASGMLGVGYAIQPSGDHAIFYSPADGQVESITETGHAYTLLTSDGVDVLLHIGVDTVNMGGSGFEALVKEGQSVKAGDPVARADLARIRERGFSTVTAVLVTDPDKIKDMEYEFGEQAGGRDAVMRYRLS